MDFTLYNQKKTNLQNHISETLGLLQSLKLKNAYTQCAWQMNALTS